MILLQEPIEFEWDEANREKVTKHGVMREEIEQAYLAGDRLVLYDKKHSQLEKRHIVIGKNVAGRWIYTVMTVRADKVRVLSARYMHKKEVELYEKSFKSTKI